MHMCLCASDYFKYCPCIPIVSFSHGTLQWIAGGFSLSCPINSTSMLGAVYALSVLYGLWVRGCVASFSLFPLPHFHRCLVLKACILLMFSCALVSAFAAPVGFYCCWMPPSTQIPSHFTQRPGCWVEGRGKCSVWESRLLASMWLAQTLFESQAGWRIWQDKETAGVSGDLQRWRRLCGWNGVWDPGEW